MLLKYECVTQPRSLEPQYYARHIPHRDQFEGMWREVIQAGVESGLFVCDDIPVAVRGLLGMLNWTITWYHPGGGRSVEDISDHYADIFLWGMETGN
jgi:hypothetical protein